MQCLGYTLKNSLFIWNSDLPGQPVFLFAESGNLREPVASISSFEDFFFFFFLMRIALW